MLADELAERLSLSVALALHDGEWDTVSDMEVEAVTLKEPIKMVDEAEKVLEGLPLRVALALGDPERERETVGDTDHVELCERLEVTEVE